MAIKNSIGRMIGLYGTATEHMEGNVRARALTAAEYIIDNRCSIRDAAKNVMISKSTIHRDIHVHLRHYDVEMYDEVIAILKINEASSIQRMVDKRRWNRATGRTTTAHYKK